VWVDGSDLSPLSGEGPRSERKPCTRSSEPGPAGAESMIPESARFPIHVPSLGALLDRALDPEQPLDRSKDESRRFGCLSRKSCTRSSERGPAGAEKLNVGRCLSAAGQ
jgi:hypothetical protein